MVESFVDPEKFCGTVYTASGWEELGLTDGWGRCARDYYVKHDKPKRLFVKELCPHARRSLQAEHLKPALAMVEDKVAPAVLSRVRQMRPLTQHFKQVPDYRARVESYPLWSLLAIVACAILSGVQADPRPWPFRQEIIAGATPGAGHSPRRQRLVSRTQPAHFFSGAPSGGPQGGQPGGAGFPSSGAGPTP